jgi:hypothetical protein
MQKKTASKKTLKTLPCPVCGRMPKLTKESTPEGTHYLYACVDVLILSQHAVIGQAWETDSMAINRWNDAIKSLEKRRAKNIEQREIWGD